MEQIRVMDAGNATRMADNSWNRAPVAKTAAYTITSADSGLLFTNRGAAGSVTFTLPAPTAGFKLRFKKVVNNQNIVITAPTAGTMIGLTAGVTLTNSTTECGTVALEADGTSWLVTEQTGTWAVT